MIVLGIILLLTAVMTPERGGEERSRPGAPSTVTP